MEVGLSPAKHLSLEVGEKVVAFYEDDSVSRMMPGMADCISIKDNNGQNVKTQKRHLVMTIAEVRRGSRGGGKGALPPPPPSPQKIAPPNSQARIQGGQEGLAPPPGAKRALPPPGAKRALPPLQNPGSAYGGTPLFYERLIV